jgi:hypothetical protein
MIVSNPVKSVYLSWGHLNLNLAVFSNFPVGSYASETDAYLKKGQKFSINRFVGNFIQPTNKIDMCPLACEKYMLFK